MEANLVLHGEQLVRDVLHGDVDFGRGLLRRGAADGRKRQAKRQHEEQKLFAVFHDLGSSAFPKVFVVPQHWTQRAGKSFARALPFTKS